MEYIEIDGSIGEGGGQILRTSLSLSSVFGQPVRIRNIRKKRKDPGLKPQHLQSVIASARICSAEVSGATIGSTELEFVPSEVPDSFSGTIDTGTAGSISLIAQTIIPISIFRKIELNVTLRGGTEVPNSPTIDYLQRIVLPVYQKLCMLDLKIVQRGYYPKGGGIVELRCNSQKESMISFDYVSKHESSKASILSVSRSLPADVCKRQLEAAKRVLINEGIQIVSAETDDDGRSLSPGSSVLIYDVSTCNLVGSSALGVKGKPSESVGVEAATGFLDEIKGSPNVDSHLADMLLTLCCVKGKTSFTTSAITNHLMTNADIARRISGCEIKFHKMGSIWLVSVSGSSEKPNR